MDKPYTIIHYIHLEDNRYHRAYVKGMVEDKDSDREIFVKDENGQISSFVSSITFIKQFFKVWSLEYKE